MPGGRPRETSLPYVPIDPFIETHDRTGALIEALARHTSLPDSLISIVPRRLLEWAGQQFQDGNIGRQTPRALLRRLAPEFGFDEQTFYDALTNDVMGFLVKASDGSLHIHDWKDGGGRVLAEREKWRNEQEQRRANAKAAKLAAQLSGRQLKDNPELSGGYPADVSEMSRLKVEGEGEGKQDRDTHMVVREMSGRQLGIDDVKQLLSQPPYGWPLMWPIDAEQAVAVLCPVDRQKVVEAADETCRRANTPGPGYFAGCLASALRPSARPKRAPANKAQQQLDDWAALVKRVNRNAP
jgi:hypothetical protein